MKRNVGKKVLSLLLIAVMLLCLAPFDFLGGLFFVSSSAEVEGYYTYTVENGKATIKGVDNSISGAVTVPDTLGGYPVTSIAETAFEYKTAITTLTIPEGVTSIGKKAFQFCNALTKIYVPNSADDIGEGAFSYGYSLESIEVGNGNPNFSSEYGVFFNKDKTRLIQYPISNTRTEYNIPDSVTDIAEGAFCGCKFLTEIAIQNNVANIGDLAFAYGTFSKITIGDSVINIGSRAFEGCFFVTEITIPNSVISIGDNAFYYCKSMDSFEVGEDNPNYSSRDGVLFNKDKTRLIQYPIANKTIHYYIPGSVTEICDYAFYCASRISQVHIPWSVKRIGNKAFSYAELLYTIIIFDNVNYIGENAFEMTRYYNDNTSWEDNVLYIGNHLIKAKTEVNGNYTVKDGTVSVASKAFSDCDLITSVTFPGSVIGIGEEAFVGCNLLATVYYGGTEDAFENAVGNNNENLTNAKIYFAGYLNAKLPEITAQKARYKNTITVKITATGIPSGGFLVVDGNRVEAQNGTATFETEFRATAGRSFTAHIESRKGDVQVAEKEYKVNVDTGLFAKLFAFFADFIFNGFKWRNVTVEF